MLRRKKPQGFGATNNDGVDVTFALKAGTEIYERPTARIYPHSDAGLAWCNSITPAFKEHVHRLYDQGPKYFKGSRESTFHYDAFSPFALNASEAGLVCRVVFPNGKCVRVNPKGRRGKGESIQESLRRSGAVSALADWQLNS